MPREARSTLAVTVLMACWWISVAIPIPVTSLLPLVLFPALGVMPSGITASSYANNNIFLFMGGFILALGVQRWGLHRRIALHIVRAIGTNPSRMVLGFMLATAFLSMWISNTATTLMMLPIGLAVIASLSEVTDAPSPGGFAPALLLGVAYSASIGGLATPIGTPPNISFLRIQEIIYPAAPVIPFGRWTLAFLPLVVVFLPITWLVLTRLVFPLKRRDVGAGATVIAAELRSLGRIGSAERRMLWIFGTTAVLWITRADLALGPITIPGWAGVIERLVGEPFSSGNLHDATVAVAMAVLTFLVPGEPDHAGRRRALMDWETAVKLPWGILLLFGGGFALAGAFQKTGLSRYLGESFAGQVEGAHPLVLVAAVCFLLTFLTEVTSNTATTEVMLPVLGGAAGAMAVHPLLLMLPATLSASCAFMLPIATPPNAIIFGSGQIEMRQMVRAGILLNLVGVVLISLFFYTVSSWILGIDLSLVPQWAAPTP
jgi:sodium-dependent dicarboxylate transporter 2/3/5